MHRNKAIGLYFIQMVFFLLASVSVWGQQQAQDDFRENPDYQVITSDISRFYAAFDLAVQNPGKATKIFKSLYFRKGSRGLQDFYKTKIQSKQDFAQFVLNFQDYYQSVREDISDLDDLRFQLDGSFRKFRVLYPEATIPDTYFVIGKFQSNGTISKHGVLIGTEVLAKTSHSDTSNWNKNLLAISMERSHIPVTVAHELVHFNQDQQREGNTLLWKSIREGSAEFIAELLTGETDGNYQEFEGKEEFIWEQFLLEKDQAIWSSWMKANESRPALAGYWMGYVICKAYFFQVKDQTQAIHDILKIQNYEEFLEKSKVEEYLFREYHQNQKE